VINRLIKQALAGLHYTLTLAVSVIVIVIAVVVFRSLVDSPEAGPTTTTTTTVPTTTAAPAAFPSVTTSPPDFDCRRDPPRGDQTLVVRLFYACGDDEAIGSTWVYREIEAGSGSLTLTMRALVAGPEPDERGDGFRSLFSPATADAVLSVARDGGAVVVDLIDLGPMPMLKVGVEGSTFLAALNNTMFQHEEVASVEYRIEGSCDRFWEYFGEDECRILDREVWEQDPAAA
jgi:hypothetical protein